MNQKERTPFGERLYQARKHAQLTQPQLAKAVGLAQSTLGELEYVGHGSTKTAQIAQRCGVRPEWLADGVGPMLDQVQRLLPEVLATAEAINQLTPTQRQWVLKITNDSIEMALATALSGKDNSQQPVSHTQALHALKRVG